MEEALTLTKKQKELKKEKEPKSKELEQVAPGVFRHRIMFVNTYLIESNGKWALIDAGLRGSSSSIINAAEKQFGKDQQPEAIFLTHGHFDHVGGIINILPHWNIPVYAHTLEMPYLTGKSHYPPADPTVGGGALASFSWMFPNHPIDISESLKAYEGERLPGFPEWKVIHTPGHSPGHVSFYRERDKVLIAGDAFVTVKQESLSAVMAQAQKVHGPPAYFTCNWLAARNSVSQLVALGPAVAACGHGIPMKGEILEIELEELVLHFDGYAMPRHGRYVKQPAITDESGVRALPPLIDADLLPKIIGIGAGVLGVAGLAVFALLRYRKQKK